MSHVPINPISLGAPKGYSNGILSEAGGKLLFVAGQIGWNERHELISQQFVEQFARALENTLSVVRAANGEPAHIVRLTIYLTDKHEYISALKQIGQRYRALMGKHYPTMAVVQVSGLMEPEARLEIEATAVVP